MKDIFKNGYIKLDEMDYFLFFIFKLHGLCFFSRIRVHELIYYTNINIDGLV